MQTSPTSLLDLDVTMEKLLKLFENVPVTFVGGRGDILTTEEVARILGKGDGDAKVLDKNLASNLKPLQR
jgi:hypothetical protein